MTVGVIGQPAPTSSPGTFTFGLNWGVAYELPNTTETARYLFYYFMQNEKLQIKNSNVTKIKKKSDRR